MNIKDCVWMLSPEKCGGNFYSDCIRNYCLSCLHHVLGMYKSCNYK